MEITTPVLHASVDSETVTHTPLPLSSVRLHALYPYVSGCRVGTTMPWEILSAILAFALIAGFSLVARRLLAKSDEYEGEGTPTLADLWSRGGGGDAGPGA
jgi:hypothetical protein